MSEQITTLTFYKFTGFKHKFWAFCMMLCAHVPLSRTSGLSFYKLLGSGKRNFNPAPDWSVYAILQVWENKLKAKEWFRDASLANSYKMKSSEQLTFYMRNLKAHGLWSSHNPFEESSAIDSSNDYIAVITRATIKLKFLKRFWNYVPTSQVDLNGNPNLLFSAGVGERPVTQMATFSLWDDKSALRKFAYRSQNHRHAVQQTQALQWYKEEMFSRFQPFSIDGSWSGFETPELLK